MKVLLIGDSFGLERVHSGSGKVATNETWPHLVMNHFNNEKIDFEIDFEGFRRIVECPAIIEKKNKLFDVIIIQAGIVDCFTRPLGIKLSKNQSLISKIVRRLVRVFRKEWMLYFNSVQWSSKNEIENAIKNLVKYGNKTGFVSCCPISLSQAINSPGAQEKLIEFNASIQKFVETDDNFFMIRPDLAFLKRDYTDYIHPKDSHFNVKGNEMMSALVIHQLNIHFKEIKTTAN